MKLKNTLLLAILFVAFCIPAQGQFLKKLQNRVEETVENVIIEKTAGKAGDKTGEGMDKLLNPNLGSMFGGGKGAKVDASSAQASYNFSYNYQLKISSKAGEMIMDYYLTPNEPYMGIKMNMGPSMFMIMDSSTDITYMFMGEGENKMATATQLDLSDVEEEAEENAIEDFTMTELPNKTFLGYDCVGKQMENAEYTFVFYIAMDAEISFNDVFKGDESKMPAAFKKHFKEGDRGLMMYMQMTDKVNKNKKKDTSAVMECLSVTPVDFNFDTTSYRFM